VIPLHASVSELLRAKTKFLIRRWRDYKNTIMNKDVLEFVTYCISCLARRLSLSKTEVYNRLNKSGILYEYVVPCYDVLHTFSTEYLMEDLTDFMKEKGVLQ
jgi:hypothetical protein